MSNVLIGIVGVILFIGVAVIGASMFGPLMTSSVDDGRATSTVQMLSATAAAVSLRNRELETTTPSGSDGSGLVPDFLDGVPTNPTNGAAVYLVDANATGTGPAAFVATKMPGDRPGMCEFMSRTGGGPVPVATATSIPSQRMGCLRVGVATGPFAQGDLVGFVRIS